MRFVVLRVWHLFLIACLIGAFPTAYLVTAKEIRTPGDGNMSARNVLRHVGSTPVVLVRLVDFLEGAPAIEIARAWRVSEGALLIIALCLTAGHAFSLFAHLRGGRGDGPILGVFGVLFPQQTLLSLAALAVGLVVSHNWDLSCTVACVLLVGLMVLSGQHVRRLLNPFVLLPTIGGCKIIQRWQAAHHPARASGR